MKKTIAIQLLSPFTKQQLIQLRDAMREVDGLNNVELEIPPLPHKQGEMSGPLGETIVLATIGGFIEAISNIGFEQLFLQLSDLLKGILGSAIENQSNPQNVNDKEESKTWEAVIINEENGIRTGFFLDGRGNQKKFTNREFSINTNHTHAILVGIAEYDDGASFSPIPPASQNIDEVYKVLNDKRLVGLPANNIIRLYNESSVIIKNELNNISKRKDIETLIIYYAGHGQNIGNNQLSLIAKDTWNIDEELHSDVPYSFIERIIKNSHASQKIIFIDACQSGLATQRSNNNGFDFETVVGNYILTSTSADKSSYFKTGSENTYFTSALIEVFKTGIQNTNTMLSLDDIYNFVKKELTARNLPLPTFKSQLNIVPEKFFISNNLSFSLDDLLKRPKKLYEQGKYDDARNEYLQLETKYPENEQLQKEHLEFEQNLKIKELIRQGDSLFWIEKDFEQAKNKYKEAYNLKQDPWIADKILECENKKHLMVLNPIAESKKGNLRDLMIEPKRSKTRKKIIIVSLLLLIGISVKVLLSSFYGNSSNKNLIKPHLNNPVKKSLLVSDKVEKNTSIPDSINKINRISDSLKKDIKKVNVIKLTKQASRINIIDKDKSFVPDSSVKPMLIALAKEGKKYFNKGNYENAYTLLFKSKEVNDPEVWFNIGYMYANGKGIKLDFKKATKYYLKSAEQGNSSAENNLGWMYSNGNGVKKSYVEAFKWYTKSAEQGNSSAQNNLGLMYEQGKGAETDIGEAILWYRRSAKHGNIDGIDNLKRLHYSDKDD